MKTLRHTRKMDIQTLRKGRKKVNGNTKNYKEKGK